MANALQLLSHVSQLPETLLYFTQAATYAMAFRAVRRGNHAPSLVYLTSCLIHLVLGVLFCLPLG
jgi:hypothetical protein